MSWCGNARGQGVRVDRRSRISALGLSRVTARGQLVRTGRSAEAGGGGGERGEEERGQGDGERGTRKRRWHDKEMRDRGGAGAPIIIASVLTDRRGD